VSVPTNNHHAVTIAMSAWYPIDRAALLVAN